MLGHIEPAGDQVTGILHRHLRKVHIRKLESRWDRVSTHGRLAHYTIKVLEINLELNRGRKDIRREGKSATRQGRAAVGETEEHIRRALVGILPVGHRRKGLATKEEHLCFLTRVFAERQRLHKILSTRDVVELAGTITVANTAEERIAPSGRKSEARASLCGGRVVRHGELHRQDNLRKTLVRVEGNRRAGATVRRLEALEEPIVSYSRITLFKTVLSPRIKCVYTSARTNRLLDVQSNLSLHSYNMVKCFVTVCG